ncbi:MAG: hypothetical protein ABIS31_04930, partial [Candidatus Eisenbacteria bacterium]
MPRTGFLAVAGVVTVTVVVPTATAVAGRVAAAIVFAGFVVVVVTVAGFVVVIVVTVAGFVVVVATIVASAVPRPARRFAVELATVTPAIVFTGGFAIATVAAAGLVAVVVGAGLTVTVVVGAALTVMVGPGFTTVATTGAGGAFVVAGFVLAPCLVATRGATATAPDSRVEAVMRPELEPPVAAPRNDQPGCAVLAAANACLAGLTAAGT